MVDTSNSRSAPCTCSATRRLQAHLRQRLGHAGDGLELTHGDGHRGRPPFLLALAHLLSIPHVLILESVISAEASENTSRAVRTYRLRNFCSRARSGLAASPSPASSPPPAWMDRTWSAICKSRSYRRSSLTMKMRSNEIRWSLWRSYVLLRRLQVVVTTLVMIREGWERMEIRWCESR